MKMLIKVSRYNNSNWDSVLIRVVGDIPVVLEEDIDGDAFLRGLPRTIVDGESITINDSPKKWAKNIARMSYTYFRVNILQQ